MRCKQLPQGKKGARVETRYRAILFGFYTGEATRQAGWRVASWRACPAILQAFSTLSMRRAAEPCSMQYLSCQRIQHNMQQVSLAASCPCFCGCAMSNLPSVSRLADEPPVTGNRGFKGAAWAPKGQLRRDSLVQSCRHWSLANGLDSYWLAIPALGQPWKRCAIRINREGFQGVKDPPILECVIRFITSRGLMTSSGTSCCVPTAQPVRL